LFGMLRCSGAQALRESETMVIKETPEVNSQIMTIYTSQVSARQREVNLGIWWR
jgi:hypothetical protein